MIAEKLQDFDPPLSKIVSVGKVAKKVGCSNITVYKVMKGNDEISEKTSIKVIQAMIELIEENKNLEITAVNKLRSLIGENLTLDA